MQRSWSGGGRECPSLYKCVAFDADIVHPYWHLNSKRTMNKLAAELGVYRPFADSECTPNSVTRSAANNPITNDYGSFLANHVALAPLNEDPIRDPRIPIKRRKTGKKSTQVPSTRPSQIGYSTSIGLVQDPSVQPTRFVGSGRILSGYERAPLVEDVIRRTQQANSAGDQQSAGVSPRKIPRLPLYPQRQQHPKSERGSLRPPLQLLSQPDTADTAEMPLTSLPTAPSTSDSSCNMHLRRQRRIPRRSPAPRRSPSLHHRRLVGYCNLL
jgi:hypothetical protein